MRESIYFFKNNQVNRVKCLFALNSLFCKEQVISILKKRQKKVKFYLDWERFSFYICTPQEGISSLIKLVKEDLKINQKYFINFL